MSYDFDRMDDPDQFDEQENGPGRRNGPAINLTGNTIRMLASLVVIGVIVLVIIIVVQGRGGDDGDLAAVTTATPADLVEDTPAIPTFTPGPTATPLDQEPEETETPEATEAPADSVAVGATVEVANTNGEGLNMRNGPGLNFAAVELLPEETELEVIGGPEEVDGYTWWQVRKTTDELEGWVAQQFIQPAGE